MGCVILTGFCVAIRLSIDVYSPSTFHLYSHLSSSTSLNSILNPLLLGCVGPALADPLHRYMPVAGLSVLSVMASISSRVISPEESCESGLSAGRSSGGDHLIRSDEDPNRNAYMGGEIIKEQMGPLI